jgi:hypothetical protein
VFGLNTNAIHQYINLAFAALGALLIASGCVASLNGSFDCTGSWINPEYTGAAILALVVLKFVMNFARDGLTGILKVQPPVADAVTTVVQPVIVAKGAEKVPETTVTVDKAFNK